MNREKRYLSPFFCQFGLRLPGGALAINPTDKFPVFVIGRYLHSLESLGGDDRERDVTEQPDSRISAFALQS